MFSSTLMVNKYDNLEKFSWNKNQINYHEKNYSEKKDKNIFFMT